MNLAVADRSLIKSPGSLNLPDELISIFDNFGKDMCYFFNFSTEPSEIQIKKIMQSAFLWVS